MSASGALTRLWAAQKSRLALWTPAIFAAGAASALDGPRLSAGMSLAAAGLGVAALISAYRFGLRARIFGAFCACFLLGASAAAWRLERVDAPVLPVEIETALEGRVRIIDASASGRARLTLDQLRIDASPAAATPQRVRVTLFSSAVKVAPGDWITLRARIAPPARASEPGGFDFSQAAWFDQLGAIGVARSPPMQVAPRAPPSFALRIDALRARLSSALRKHIPGEAGALAAAITVGDRAAVSPSMLEALRRSNLSHLLSISGLHMAIVAGLAYAGARLALAVIPGAALWWRAKKLAALAGLATGAFYLALSGGSTPTQRAFVMAAVAFGAMLLNRPAVTIRALALAALVVLAVAPESLFEVGFQLSFAAALALVAAFDEARRRGWTDPAPGRRAGARRWAAALIASSLIAGLATAPIAAFHFNRIAPWGFPANLAAVPVMSLLVAPALAMAALLAPLGLAQPCLWVAGRGLDWISSVAYAAAAAPGAAKGVAAAPDGALLAYGAGLLWLCLWTGRFRLLGLLGFVLAAGVWLSASRPVLLIADGGVATGVMTAQGRAAEGAKRADFTISQWLRRDGEVTDAASARARKAYRALEAGWLEADLPQGWRVRINRRARPQHIERMCAPRALVLTPALWSAPDGQCVMVDGRALSEGGAMSVKIDARGAISLRSAQ